MQEDSLKSKNSDQEATVCIVIPAYNEEKAIAEQIQKVRSVMGQTDWHYQIIVVDDGSTDRTAEEASKYEVQLIRLPRNRGYGAALKAGISAARSDYIVIIDADGTYPAEAIPELLAKVPEYDMVVGARIGPNAQIPSLRKPAKWFLTKLASYLAEQPIPDLNSGLRVMKKAVVEQFYYILPSGFSFTTTITLALLCNDYLVYYHPIEYYRRVGQSKIRPVDTYHFSLLIVRTIVYFNPLRVFLPLGLILFLIGVAKFIYDLFLENLSETAVTGFLGAFIVWALGLLADQIAKVGLGSRLKR
ncbi:MAG TPA: glycosyltransferase family 2 protein [Candidatus Limnocylindrales bacterium]|nr:glycosyltransferase family 2 protein [Candidatus Limnocylindrales bacterium]